MLNNISRQEIDILLVEYDPEEAKRIRSLVKRTSSRIHVKWVQTLNDTIKFIFKHKFNEILLSLDLPDVKGERTLIELREKAPDLPIVVVTDSEKKAGLELLEKGADDLLFRQYLNTPLLLKTIFSAIAKKKIENQLKTYKKQLEYNNIERKKEISKTKDGIRRIGINYHIISGISRAGLKVDDLHSFIAEICKIISEKARFTAVWIGRVDRESNILKVEAYEGKKELFNDSVNLSDSTHPIAAAVKYGKHVIIDDINVKSKIGHGFTGVRNVGYKSFATFPIIIKGKIWGALNLYSQNRYFFTTQEVKLLDDLAIDISSVIALYMEKQASANKNRLKSNNELKYKNLFEKNLAGVYRTTLDGRILVSNKKFIQMMGYKTLAEMKKQKFPDFFENKEDREAFVKELIERGHLENVEHKLIRKDGSLICVLKNVSLQNDEVTGEKIIQSTAVDITKTRYYLDELKIREDMLKAIAEAAAEIFKTEDLEKSVENILRKLGTITNVSRVYLFENHTDNDGVIYSSQRFEWAAENITEQIHNPDLQNFPLEKSGYGRWIRILSKGEIIKGDVDDFPESERDLLKSQKILSIMVLPIFIGKKWYGFVGFDSCYRKRKWSDTEENTLKAIANLLGNAIQRNLLEKELRLREAKLKETSLLAGVGHFEFDISSNTISFSEGFYSIFGEDIGKLGNTFDEIKKYIHPEDRKMVADIFQYSIATEKSGDTIFRILSPDNSVKKIWAKWKAVIDEKGNGSYLKGIILDITERDAAEERLLKLSQAVEVSPALVIITDNEQRIEYVNKKFMSVTGYSFDEVRGMKPSMWASGHHGDDFYEEMLDTIFSGKEWTGEIKNRKKNGESYWIWSSISPLINTDGDITHFIQVSLEITEKKRLSEQLIIERKRAEESDKIKSEFLALISHEIRTPINAILGYKILIEEETDVKLNEKLLYAFNGIDEATSRIIRSIEMVINAAEIISGSYDVEKVLLDLKSLIEEVYPEYKTKAEKKNLEFRFICKTDDTIVEIDKYSILQMLIYLLENAVKFTNHGRIEIKLVRDEEGRLVLSILDTGIGMHSSFLDKIFIPFSQEDSGLSRAFEGMGLGSTLIKQYAEINNANIRLESVKDIGTTFDIIFD